jgi:hypothetical protein
MCQMEPLDTGQIKEEPLDPLDTGQIKEEPLDMNDPIDSDMQQPSVIITEQPFNVSSLIKTKEFSCGQCGAEFSTKSSAQRHISTRHVVKQQLRCEKCDYQTTSTVRMENHSTKHEQVVTCTICEMTFSSDQELSTHLVSHEATPNDDGSLKCVDCDQLLYGLGALRKHRNKVHVQNISHKFNCNECGQTFPFNKSLKNHILIHHPTDEYLQSVSSQCEECNQMFETAQGLNQHQLICLETPNSFPCKECSSNWTSATSLKKHYAEHHSLMKEVCNVCGATITIGGLNEHKKMHTSTKDNACEHCAKKFLRKRHLNFHIKTVHMKQGLHQCPQCDRRCALMSQLKRHINSRHTKEIKYPCDQCKFFTHDKKHLTQHKKNIH